MGRISRNLRFLFIWINIFMKTLKTLLFITIAIASITASAAVWMGPDGLVWGNICLTRAGWQQVYPQPVGSQCFAPNLQAYGFIGNV
jgi:hypothetical protein